MTIPGPNWRGQSRMGTVPPSGIDKSDPPKSADDLCCSLCDFVRKTQYRLHNHAQVPSSTVNRPIASLAPFR